MTRNEPRELEIVPERRAHGVPAERADLLAELAVTRRLLAGMAAAAVILGRYAELDSTSVQDVLDRLRQDSRIDDRAAEAAIAHLAVELAKPA